MRSLPFVLLALAIVVEFSYGFSWTQHCNNPQHQCAINGSLTTGLRASPYPTLVRQDLNLWTLAGASVNDPVMDTNLDIYYVRHIVYLRSLNSFTNEPIWENGTIGSDRFTSTPVLVNGLAILTGLNYVYAFDTQSGNIAWLFAPHGYQSFNATNYPMVDKNGNVIVTGYLNSNISAVISFKPNLENYTINWQFVVPDTYTVTSPAVLSNDETDLYFVSYNSSYPVSATPSIKWYTLFALNGTMKATVEYSCSWLECTSFNDVFVTPKGKLVIQDMGPTPVVSHWIDPTTTTKIVIPAFVWVADSNDTLYGVNGAAVNGYRINNGQQEIVWTTTGSWSSSALSTSMLLVEGSMLYVTVIQVLGTPGLYLVAFDINDQIELWNSRFGFDSNIVSSPPIVMPGGNLYIRMGPNLYNITCCSGQGSCSVGNACKCNPNYYSSNCSVYCEVNSCPFPNAVCGDTGCACQNNYFPNNNCTVFCNMSLCASSHNNHAACSSVGECACLPNYYGSACQTYCAAATCLGNGVCTNNGTCSCNTHFYGGNCSAFCVNGVFSEANYTCSCNDNYFGSVCDVFCDRASNCSGRGNCSASAKCVCDPSYYGDACATFCDSNTCSGHGTCTALGACECSNSYYGTNCASYCNHGTIKEGQCHCDSGWKGSECSDRLTDDNTGMWIGVGIGVAAIVGAGVVFFILWKKRQQGGYQLIG